MVALNEKFSHSGLPASEGHVSPHEIDAFDFTKRSEEVRGGSIVNFGVSGFRELSDTSPLRRRSAAPLNQSDPETQLYYVRTRTYNPALGRWIQRDPIGYSGGINLYEYVGGRAAVALDPRGLCAKQCQVPRKGYIPIPNGCGAKNGFRPPQGGPGWTFNPACNAHDICYGTCNSSKAICDKNLYNAMLDACDQFWNALPGWEHWNPAAIALFDACLSQAKAYYEAVNLFGQGPFNAAQKEACVCNQCCQSLLDWTSGGTPNPTV